MLFARVENRTTTYGRADKHLKRHPRILRNRPCAVVKRTSIDDFCVDDLVDLIASPDIGDYLVDLVVGAQAQQDQ
jgi:hypothetical protein